MCLGMPSALAAPICSGSAQPALQAATDWFMTFLTVHASTFWLSDDMFLQRGVVRLAQM